MYWKLDIYYRDCDLILLRKDWIAISDNKIDRKQDEKLPQINGLLGKKLVKKEHHHHHIYKR